MRIVIETDQHADELKSVTAATAEAAGAATIIDGGPAPAALLRQFGRVTEPTGAQVDEEEGAGAAAHDEMVEEPLNPLRRGHAIATHRLDPDSDTRQEADESTTE
jgi:hypothetical protein